MARHVVAFVGENENGILADFSRAIMEPLAPMGLRGHVIDLHQPGWADALQPLAREGIAFAWGAAGIGARLEVGGENLWEMLQVPFISTLADTPCQLPANHRVASRFVANGYMYRDWLDVQRRFIRSPQISALLPHGVLPNPARDRIPWARRPHRMVFVKTGEDPERRQAEWRNWPAPLRAVLHDATAEAARQPTGDITHTVLGACEAHGLHLEERLELLFAIAFQVDLQLRALRANAFARALLPLDAVIIGRGWDHLPLDGARAGWRPAIPAAELPGLYAATQFLVSTNPNFAHGVHERIPNGFAARACVLSDSNAFTRARFAALPSFFGLDWTAPELAARIAAIFHDATDHGPLTDAALAVADEDFGPRRFLQGMIDLADLLRAGNRLESFPA
ncbi:hypothetical protein J8J14_11820 [Roseomonas sp. SSH11]|uniref:Glycosyltransferase family 1 protein n=1 Tax=Pararoseomonas baculiformis TaxID=2820812 RepID=A0ABS4AG19_9PROT|nr:hypothetical protein [Pararoseomonas baculiformis]MBP0445465.1 hypothetical protein [Pararoseomonas baculiformis]